MTHREAWLLALAEKLRPDFTAHGAMIPTKLRISCGWPSTRALSGRNRAIGECWTPTASQDGTTEIFVSPCIDAPLMVAEILVHELVHAAVGTECGHKGAFKRLACMIGLEGPMRSSHAGEALRERLNILIAELGSYPHATLDAAQGSRKKQTTRLLKVLCPVCGYTVRTTRQWLAQGLPTCPCSTEMIESNA
jgi:hypothetical protein